jgi:hypothetical protein
MVQRCTRPNDPSWSRYGGAGIRVCDGWLGRDGFIQFLSDMGVRPQGTTIDRFPDKAGHYEPRNCRWASVIEQNNNKRTSRVLVLDGRTQTVSEWAREMGVRPGTILQRLHYGWSDRDAITRPVAARS